MKLKVSIAVERFLSVKIKSWKSKYFKPLYALIICIVLVVGFIMFNCNVLFTITFVLTNYTSVNGACSSSAGYKLWRPLHGYVYSIVPFFFLVIFNILLIREVALHKNKVANAGSKTEIKRKQMTISIIALTFAFIVLTGPFSIAGKLVSIVKFIF